MNMVKKHILSIVCGVIALAALVLAFWPLGSMEAEEQAELNKRVKLYGELKSLRQKKHTVPSFDFTASEAETLKSFPTQKSIERAGAVIEDLRRERASVVTTATQASKRELLVENVLPEPRGSTELYFRDRYLRAIAELSKEMNAGQPPSAEELAVARQNLWRTEYEPKILMRNNVPDPESQAAYQRAFELDTLGFAEREKRRRAAEISLYVPPTAGAPGSTPAGDGLQIWPGITASASNLTARTIWYAQLSLWLQQDMVRVVKTLNNGKSVTEAPIKQWVRFEMDAMPYRLAVTPSAEGQSPVAVAPTGPVFTETWTGRVCNPLFDVVKFRLTADVRADDIPRLLQEIGRGRLITPVNIDVTAVDPYSMAAAPSNMLYGKDPVARVVIRCEALFLRSWTLPLMPTEVKQKDLAIAATPNE